MKHQKGQSLVFLLGFTAALIGAMLLVFNTGQVTADKERLVNAADAAAYSGAIWEARALNFQSYMNRAIVANEVAIAQSVSLRSWVDYVRSSLNNVNMITQFVPYLGAVTRALAQASTQIHRGAQTILPRAEQGISVVNTFLSRAETTVHFATVLAAKQIAEETLRANNPANRPTRATTIAFFVTNNRAWLNFTRGFSGNDRARLKDVVVRSRDGFTANRGHELDMFIVELQKRGGTQLFGFDTWRGVDTMSLHTPDFLFDFEESVPIGFGSAQNGPQNVNLGQVARSDYGNSRRVNPLATRLAILQHNRDGRKATGYRGLQPTRDINNSQRQDDRSLDFVVEVERGRNTLATSDRALGIDGARLYSGGTASQRPDLHKDKMYAISTAQVYFQRPVGREDGRREFPSLYNPYWQVRLAAVSRSSRLAAAIDKRLVDPYVLN
jgi:hypothetical protein